MTAFLKRLSALTRSRKAQLALALRVTVAAVGAFAIASALHLMLPLWAVLTSLIVTQMSVGRSLKATRDYMFGTVGGAIYGGAIAVLIPHSGEIGLLALLVLAVAPLAQSRSIPRKLSMAVSRCSMPSVSALRAASKFGEGCSSSHAPSWSH